MRNLLIAKVCGADSDLIAATADQRPALAKAASLFSEEDLTRFFQILLQTDDDLRRKPDPRVHLEMGLLRLINAARLAPLEELLTEIKSGTGGVGGGPVPVRRAASASATSAGTGGTSAVQTSSAIPVKTLMNVPPPVTYKDDESRPGIGAASNGAVMNASSITGVRDLSMPTGAGFEASNALTFDSAAATKAEPIAPRPNGASAHKNGKQKRYPAKMAE